MKMMSRWSAALVLTLAANVAIAPLMAQQPNPERNAYFGETHIHTSWSFDAYVFGNMKAGPEDAYKFAMGQPIEHPAGYEVKITRPLDFMAVTDHAEYVGHGSAGKRSQFADQQIAHRGKAEGPKQRRHHAGVLVSRRFTHQERANHGAGEPREWRVASGSRLSAIADKYYQPGKFTTFVAYEWTSTPDNRNMHRNIIFKDSKKVPEYPFSSLDSDHPEDLWNWMDDAAQGRQ